MGDVFCAICGTGILSAHDQVNPPEHRAEPGEKLYCPHCEMMVDWLDHSVRQPYTVELPNPGRVPSGGTNAGGSQRGDLSDQGATQWLQDPADAERNTWSDKD